MTLIGSAIRLARGEERSARDAFLATHPDASYYVEFGDFGFWRLPVDHLRYIGGYGRMSWVSPAAWRDATPDPLASAAAKIVRRMNDDHADSLALCCRGFSKAHDTTAATMTAVDRYGFEMTAITARGPRPIRLAFPAPVDDAETARAELVALAARARAQAGSMR